MIQTESGSRYIKLSIIDFYGTSEEQRVPEVWEKIMKRYEESRGFRLDDNNISIPKGAFSCLLSQHGLIYDSDVSDFAILLKNVYSAAFQKIFTGDFDTDIFFEQADIFI